MMCDKHTHDTLSSFRDLASSSDAISLCSFLVYMCSLSLRARALHLRDASFGKLLQIKLATSVVYLPPTALSAIFSDTFQSFIKLISLV